MQKIHTLALTILMSIPTQLIPAAHPRGKTKTTVLPEKTITNLAITHYPPVKPIPSVFSLNETCFDLLINSFNTDRSKMDREFSHIEKSNDQLQEFCAAIEEAYIKEMSAPTSKPNLTFVKKLLELVATSSNEKAREWANFCLQDIDKEYIDKEFQSAPVLIDTIEKPSTSDDSSMLYTTITSFSLMVLIKNRSLPELMRLYHARKHTSLPTIDTENLITEELVKLKVAVLC